MASAVQKITLSSSRDIPLNKLILSQSNVRRVKAGVSIEDLAADIARRGCLLQSLNVRPVLDEEGVETGMFEVPAGGRRFQALQLLVKQKRLTKTAPVPCVVRDPSTKILAEDDSLAENVQRVPLHPLDQFRAFQTLRDKGLCDEDIAAAYFVGVNVVKQRLRIAAVSEKLLDIYAEDGMSLEQLMAFTVTTDHARQLQVWDALQRSYSQEPYQIRRMLTEKTVRASDRRVLFVGIGAYENAGGVVMRDLFQQDDGGWLENIGLLETLVAEKLKTDAEHIATEGWKWIEVAVDFPYGHDHGLRELDGIPADLTDDERATREALRTEFDQLQAQYEDADELPDEVDQRLSEIETALEAFESRPHVFDPADISRAGVFVSIAHDGQLQVDRGYVRPEDEAPVVEPGQEDRDDLEQVRIDNDTSPVQRVVITIGGQAEPEDDEDDVVKPLPDRLLSELTAYRTLALRDAVANNPHVAMTALLHKLCLDAFQHTATGNCLEASVRHVFFSIQSADLKESPSAKAVTERHDAWKADMPKDEAALWDWLAALDDASRAALLAHCVSFGVNALYEKGDRYGGPGLSVHGVQHRLAQADRLARAVGLDMVDAGWRPTVENYLGRVTKPRILEAVREANGEQSAQLIDHLKKADMAKEAERLLNGTGWLPEPLRSSEATTADIGDADANGGEEEALPAFLADGEDTASEDETDAPVVIAAE
ncbi:MULTISPECIES: ParB/RepB/Spo0J family partition protein [Alphaproteobacteria]|jgi:ParB family chromosome partitioning protein|uniref:ParB/RepB/Spo0J family partition protein n=2 Tax=Pseudomonadota TaxID=1224 RepID=A0A927ECY6_9HYPH|nr:MULTISPECIES: ParB/RepB/Spo0J family partition protein [Alphaproteobacteria]ODT32616.1 MAG: DNA-binding protein [Kaistia sp. SCN 65-12]MBD3848657.1 ParB/RepB/Spo0J family partition protein [Bosea spartocytisi]MBN9255367.1 ParB/RepB/Spo0J family partition protein [Mesorhizobium sp.]MCT4471689.1 ParB/RepB/Spo0J family partition protein [Bosea spartocytisi]ODU80613.1 MAG: DNA-binding protein [Novosphingobium sp. SCN 63-17]